VNSLAEGQRLHRVRAPQSRFPKGLPSFTLMLDSLAAEYPAVDRSAVGPLLQHWLPEWEKLRLASKPSSLMEPKAAI